MVGKRKVALTLAQIKREIVINYSPGRHFPMRFGQDICVTEDGVNARNDLAMKLFEDKQIVNKWSEKSLVEKLDNTIQEIGISTKSGLYPDFDELAKNLIRDLDQQFDEREAITIIEGLTVEQPLSIGNIIFLPIANKEAILDQPMSSVLFEDVSPHRDCIASAKYPVENYRAIELLRRDTEYCLNILRFLATLVWYREPTRQVNIAGEPRQTSPFSLVLEADGQQYAASDADFSVLPINLSGKTLPYFEFNGLAQIQHILSKTRRNDLENSLLTGIQWFGDATRELQPLAAFLKFYMPLEIVLKGEEENAKESVPKRIARMLEPWSTDKKKHSRLVAEVQDLITERNAVFHGGSPRKRTPEYLRFAARFYSAACLNQTRQRITVEKLSSRQDLYNWVREQAMKFPLR